MDAEGLKDEPADAATPATAPSILDLMGKAPFTEVTSARIAMGRLVNPLFYGIDPGQIPLAAPELTMRVTKPGLHVALHRERGRGERQAGTAIDGLLLPAREFEIIPISVEMLRRRTAAKTLIAQVDTSYSEVKLAKAERSGLHALESKRERLSQLIADYDSRFDRLAVLRRHLKAPGRAHFSQSNLRMRGMEAIHSWLEMLDVLAVNEGWSNSQRMAMEIALANNIFLGAQREKIRRYEQLLQLSLLYLTERRNLAGGRRHQIQKTLAKPASS